MIKKFGASLFLLVFFIGLASASIEITQPLETYNFGDSIYTTVNVNPSSVSGSFEINVVCESQTENVYKIAPADSAFTANQEQSINHRIVLTKEYLGNLSGECNLVAKLGSEKVSSNSFLLTSEINLETKTDKYSYNPGEAIEISIEAIKANGIPLNGRVEISGATNVLKEITDGNTKEIFSMPETTEAGRYNLTVLVYDSDENGILNEKTETINFEIKTVPKSIAISLPGLEVDPDTDFEFGLDLYDQSGRVMERSLSVLILDSKGTEILQSTTDSGATTKVPIAANALPGEYRLIVSFESLAEEKRFTVTEKPKIQIEFLENTSLLIVKNLGNALYDDYINVTIGDSLSETLKLKIEAGEERRFSLKAPNGVYSVRAISNSGEETSRELLLTGRAISVSENNSLGVLSKYPWIWIFIIILLLLVAILLISKFRKTYNYKELFSKKDTKLKKEKMKFFKFPKKDSVGSYSEKKGKSDFVDISSSGVVGDAKHTLNVQGSKHQTSVISLNIKNLPDLNDHTRKNLQEILEVAKDSKAVLDWKEDQVLIIFSPLVTKTFKNEIIASKLAWKIREALDIYNKKFKERIDYNLGINTGEMVSSLENGKLNYTSLGSTVINAKKISDLSKGKILVSREFRQKLMRELKVDRFETENPDLAVFEITKIADVEANQDKLRDLLKRTHFDK